MAQDFYDVGLGVQVDGGAVLIYVSGAPGGSSPADDVAIGSIAMSDNGEVYKKATAGTGTDKWQTMGASVIWLDPALVKEDTTYANLAAAETAMNGGTVDGVSVSTGDRILYTGITGSNKNVYEITGTVGAGATLVEVNTLDIGDTIFIEDGTHAGCTFSYNGTDWVKSNQASLDELGFIRAFIGKNAAGSETPTYSSVQVVTQNTDLEAAIGELDAVANVPAVQLGVTGGTLTTVDSVLVDNIAACTWKLYVTETANQLTRALLVQALHNGNATNDASNVKHNVSAVLKLGNIVGLTVDVDLNGTGAGQEMRLRVQATNACDFRAVREEYIDLNVT